MALSGLSKLTLIKLAISQFWFLPILIMAATSFTLGTEYVQRQPIQVLYRSMGIISHARKSPEYPKNFYYMHENEQLQTANFPSGMGLISLK